MIRIDINNRLTNHTLGSRKEASAELKKLTLRVSETVATVFTK